MKKIILLAALALGSFVNAQDITVITQGNGGVINDGDSFTYNTLWSLQQESLGKLNFRVANNTEETLNIQVRVDEITNSDGTNVQMCFGICLAEIEVGEFYPGFNYGIAAGETSQVGDHFANGNAGIDTSSDVVYKLTFVKMSEDEQPLEDLVTFTYKYSPTAGLTEIAALTNIGIAISNTIVTNQINLTATTAASLQLFNVNGQVVKTYAINAGTQTIDASAIATGVYVAKFTTEDNKTSSVRIVKN